MIKKLDHIGVAVPELTEALKFYEGSLGLVCKEVEEVATEKVRVAILSAGATRIELLEPLTADSPISQFLQKRGGGVHHLAFAVKNVVEEVTRLKKMGVVMIDPAPRPGAGGCMVAFIHPKSAKGLLIELVERPSEA